MFRPDPSLTYVDVDRDQVVSIIESIDHPHVGVPGYAPQVTSAYVVGRRNPSGNFAILIFLHLTETNEAVLYVHDLAEVGITEFPDVEAEALTFVESMGFMVDNVNYRNLSPLQQDEILESLPCFRADIASYVPAGSEAEAGSDPLAELEEDTADILDLDEEAIVGNPALGYDPALDLEPPPAPMADVLEELDEVELLPDRRPLDPATAARVARLLVSF